MFSVKKFSERLTEVRKNKNVAAKNVAEALGLSKAAVSQFESGKNAPSVAVLCALADYFGVSIDYLVGRTDNPEIKR